MMNKRIYYFIICLILFLSFRFYAAMYYPILNSDNAVTILMIHYFSLPHDLYFWGQDRIGSIIPLLGQIPFKLFGFSALLSESLTHYAILLVGFLAFASFLKSHFLWLVFAIIWFFPPLHFIDTIQLYSGVEYSLIAVACYLILQLQKKPPQEHWLLPHLKLLSVTVLLIASVWVSDMALVTIGLLLAVLAFFHFRNHRSLVSIFREPGLYYAGVGIIAGYFFIHYAKNQSAERHQYQNIGDWDTVSKIVSVFLNSVGDMLTFKANQPFTSIYFYLVLLIVSILLYRNKLQLREIFRNQWLLFFLADAVVLFGIIMVSEWTFLNGVPRRYFTSTYISFSFFLLLFADQYSVRPAFQKLMLFTALTGGLGALYNIGFVWPGTFRPKADIVREFESLGQIGIIADYWNSYVVACVSPEQIKATPHDTTWAVRNYEFVDQVFQQENIYVIRDMWMDSFPDTITEFGRKLIREGNAFHLGDSEVCKYHKLGH